MKIKPGVYQHFKGNDYVVLDTAFDCRTTDQVVVYQALYGNRNLFTRPVHEFNECVTRDGETVPRFRYKDNRWAKFHNFTTYVVAAVFILEFPIFFILSMFIHGWDKSIALYKEFINRAFT